MTHRDGGIFGFSPNTCEFPSPITRLQAGPEPLPAGLNEMNLPQWPVALNVTKQKRTAFSTPHFVRCFNFLVLLYHTSSASKEQALCSDTSSMLLIKDI
jgi:hypothetical protein